MTSAYTNVHLFLERLGVRPLGEAVIASVESHFLLCVPSEKIKLQIEDPESCG